MDIIPENEVYTDARNTKKTFLLTDAICIDCGCIFNSNYEDKCVICDDDINIENEIKANKSKCQHRHFIIGKQSVDIRILLNFSAEDVIALCELHGCSTGSRTKMTANIMKKIYPYLDEKIDEILIRKIIKRNHRRFWYIKDIGVALESVKSKKRLKVVDASECVEINDIKSLKDAKK